MRKPVFFLLLYFATELYAQEKVVAIKEILETMPISATSTGIQYFSTEEGIFSPNGPFLDGNGALYFFPTYSRENLLKLMSGSLSRIGLTPNRSDYEKLISASYIFVSQQGTISVPGNGLTFNYYSNIFHEQYFEWGDLKVRARDYTLTPVPKGMFLNSVSQRVSISAEFELDGKIRIRDLEETRAWLPTQPGGFTIGDDGLLYRNGILWSAVPPIGGTYAERYIGRLMSGHQVWVGGGIGEFCRFITISNSTGHIELLVELPWAPQMEPRKYGFNPFNYGLGPWGVQGQHNSPAGGADVFLDN